jgi:putative ABC transport system ATP-binding protein
MISLRGISKAYGAGDRAVQALAGIDLDIAAGEAVAVVGRSGSGKTTLLDILATLLRPSSGRYLLGGEDLAAADEQMLARTRNRRFGFVFQSFHLLPELTVLQNICLPGRYRPAGPASLSEAARHWLDELELGGLGNRRPAELSGGQQQRVAIARALVTNPDVVFADEPTGNLDAETGDTVIRLLLEVAREGRTLILVTHDRDLAARFPRCIELADGRCVEGAGAAMAHA